MRVTIYVNPLGYFTAGPVLRRPVTPGTWRPLLTWKHRRHRGEPAAAIRRMYGELLMRMKQSREERGS